MAIARRSCSVVFINSVKFPSASALQSVLMAFTLANFAVLFRWNRAALIDRNRLELFNANIHALFGDKLFGDLLPPAAVS